jgi:hypothetical protein
MFVCGVLFVVGMIKISSKFLAELFFVLRGRNTDKFNQLADGTAAQERAARI